MKTPLNSRLFALISTKGERKLKIVRKLKPRADGGKVFGSDRER